MDNLRVGLELDGLIFPLGNGHTTTVGALRQFALNVRYSE
jgi:hypothetical protein